MSVHLGDDINALSSTTSRFQILALSGGGFRGLYTAKLLAKLENHAKKPLSEIFDLIAGTSVGAIIASGLALGLKAQDIADAFETQGSSIFKPPPLGFLKQLVTNKYDQAPLRNSIKTILGNHNTNKLLENIDTPLLIPTVSQTLAKPVMMASGGFSGTSATSVKVIDAILASSAAPTFFPPHSINGETFVDGGIVANAPDFAAISQTLALKAIDIKNLHVLSVGTAGHRKDIAYQSIGNPGIFGWMIRRKLYQLTISVQERLIVEQCEALLGKRYCRLDYIPTEKQYKFLDLDVVTPVSRETLMGFADQTFKETFKTDHVRLDTFLSHKRA